MAQHIGRNRLLPADGATWPTDQQSPRVLLEIPDGALAWATERALTPGGFEVVTCPGPSARDRTTCPLEANGRCALLEGADVIVFSASGSDRRERTRLFEAIRSVRPSAPVFVEPSGIDDGTDGDVVPIPGSQRALLEAVQRVCADTGVAGRR